MTGFMTEKFMRFKIQSFESVIFGATISDTLVKRIMNFQRIRVVGKNEKLESIKLESLRLVSLAEVGESQAKLERTERSWKKPIEVGKKRAKLESFF